MLHCPDLTDPVHLWLTRRREANVRVRWPIQPLSQCPGRQASASQARRTPRQTPARCTAPAPPAPHTPQPLPHRSLRLCHNPRRCLGSGGLGLPHRACPSSMGPSSPGLYPTVRPPDAAARFRRERRGQGRDPSQRAVPLTVGQGWVRGNKEGQGVVRVSIRHRPCSRRRRATTSHCARQRRSTSARMKRAASPRSARPPHGDHTTHRARHTVESMDWHG